MCKYCFKCISILESNELKMVILDYNIKSKIDRIRIKNCIGIKTFFLFIRVTCNFIIFVIFFLMPCVKNVLDLFAEDLHGCS